MNDEIGGETGHQVRDNYIYTEVLVVRYADTGLHRLANALSAELPFGKNFLTPHLDGTSANLFFLCSYNCGRTLSPFDDNPEEL